MLSDSAKEGISKIIEGIFDKIAFKFLGNTPRLAGKKLFAISTKPNLGLANLFVQAIDNRPPNSIEKEALKRLLTSAQGYIDVLKDSTKESVLQRLATGEAVAEVVDSEMKSATYKMARIVGSETTKTRNVAFTMDFTRVAADLGDTDPTCYFVVVNDKSTCKVCIKLHLHEDGTPKVFRYSELSKSYYVRGEKYPSILGQHPFCRCSCAYLAPGWGFDSKGKASFINKNHDEYAKQRA